MDIIHLLSILIEVVVAIIGLVLGIEKKKIYGYFFALTFGIYVFYDLIRYFSMQISQDILYSSFFVASVSSLYGIWRLYKNTK